MSGFPQLPGRLRQPLKIHLPTCNAGQTFISAKKRR
jgi:hypothetical protein